METKERDIHIKVDQDMWELIKVEAIRRGLTTKAFIVGCVMEIVHKDRK